MSPQLQIALVSALAVVLGSLVGAIISYLTNKHLNRQKWELEQRERQAAAREQLYGEYLAEAGRVLISAIDKKASHMSEFTLHFSLLSRVRLVGTAPVVRAAEALAKRVTAAHSTWPPKPDDHTNTAHPTESFITAVREELAQLRRKT